MVGLRAVDRRRVILASTVDWVSGRVAAPSKVGAPSFEPSDVNARDFPVAGVEAIGAHDGSRFGDNFALGGFADCTFAHSFDDLHPDPELNEFLLALDRVRSLQSP